MEQESNASLGLAGRPVAGRLRGDYDRHVAEHLGHNTRRNWRLMCQLTNDDGTWFVSNTPGSVVVDRSYSDLSVTCTKSGYHAATIAVSSKTKAMAAGNILFGGIIGGAIDVGTGAAYDYPSLITIPMTPNQRARVEDDAAAPNEAGTSSASVEERLGQLERLVEQELITRAEYMEKRREILADF